MKPIFLAIPVMFMAATTLPALPAFAHDDEDTRAADHREHRATHEDLNEAHEQAHDEGFSSRREHRAYHRALRGAHEEFHEDHPNTRHDHYRYYQPFRWWRYGY